MTDAALGRGLAFPLGVDADGRIAWSAGTENIRQSIRLILTTERLERVMRPTFGGGLRAFLFRPNVASTHRLIEEAITQSLGRWERRIALQSVRVGPDPQDADAVLAALRYRIVSDARVEEMRLGVRLS